MTRFNQAVRPTTVTNLAGGEAHAQSPALELVSLLLTSFAADQYYRTASESFERLKELVKANHKEFAAKAAVYARTVYGMRSISHVCASELARHIAGETWAKAFYAKVIDRPDDMTEILAYHKANNGKITAAMKKGFADAFAKFDKYQLSKYRGENKDVKLVDVVNLVRPRPTEKNKEALTALVKGELKSTETWETKMTQAGQQAETEEEKQELNKEVWTELVKTKKIGYFALLRNLRNILEQAPEIVPQAVERLTEERAIRNSKVLPFRFLTAFEEIMKVPSTPASRAVIVGLTKAVDISTANVPALDGDTLVVLDVSGSMQGKPAQIGSLFAAVLIKANNADFMVFNDRAQYMAINPADTTLTIANSIRFSSGGTDFHSIFKAAARKYDRIIILSDMQGWVGHYTPKAELAEYKQRTKASPKIYSFDLSSYGSMQFPEKDVFALAGFSEKIFDVMKLMESDKDALVKEINKLEW